MSFSGYPMTSRIIYVCVGHTTTLPKDESHLLVSTLAVIDTVRARQLGFGMETMG